MELSLLPHSRTVLLLPHSRDSSIITTLSGQVYYYHTLGTGLLLPHSRDSSIITTLSGQFYHYYMYYGFFVEN
jgi:hypothetical protein